MQILENFHFLRPLWFIALLPAGLVLFAMHQRHDQVHAYRRIIAPHLLNHLIVGEDRKTRFKPILFLALLWGLIILALAGPTFTLEPSPFSEDTASVMIALKVTPSMQEKDVQPSRLIRSAQKISDLLEQRPGTKTGLIAFSGTAHLAMPLTTDPTVISLFAGELSPEIMPEKGSDITSALKLSDHWLNKSRSSGATLLIVDDISPDQVSALQSYGDTTNTDVHLYCVAAEPDAGRLKKAAAALNASLTFVTADDSDIRRLSSQISHRFSRAKQADEGTRWKDTGYYLVPVIALLSLLWFRRGWLVKWEQ